jgi:hypothetical protein
MNHECKCRVCRILLFTSNNPRFAEDEEEEEEKMKNT